MSKYRVETFGPFEISETDNFAEFTSKDGDGVDIPLQNGVARVRVTVRKRPGEPSEPFEHQIGRLAKCIMAEVEGEPSTSDGAVDVAIRLIKHAYGHRPLDLGPTIAVDFDGVIHSYVSGWKGVDGIPDPPVPGAIEWLNDVVTECRVVIHTTRAESPKGVAAIVEWLKRNGATPQLYNSTITNKKVPAVVYIDDRAFRFTGTFPSIEKLLIGMKPWYKQPSFSGPHIGTRGRTRSEAAHAAIDMMEREGLLDDSKCVELKFGTDTGDYRHTCTVVDTVAEPMDLTKIPL
jgi:hypothetical protein